MEICVGTMLQMSSSASKEKMITMSVAHPSDPAQIEAKFDGAKAADRLLKRNLTGMAK